MVYIMKNIKVRHRWYGDYLKRSEGGPDIRTVLKQVNETVDGVRGKTHKSIYIGNTTAVLEATTFESMFKAFKLFKNAGLIDTIENEKGNIETIDDWWS